MKGQRESNINDWFPFMYSPKWKTVQPPDFQNRTILFCLPIPILIYLWEIYIFPGSVSLFCCSQIWGHMNVDTWMWKLGLGRAIPIKGIHKSDFLCSAVHYTTPWVFTDVRMCLCIRLLDCTCKSFQQININVSGLNFIISVILSLVLYLIIVFFDYVFRDFFCLSHKTTY